MNAHPDPAVVQTLGRILSDNAVRFPGEYAYRMGLDGITHAELYERATRLVAALAEHGVRRGDRVVLLGRNSLDFAMVLAATQLSGIILVPLSFRLSSREVVDALQRVAPKFFFCDNEFLAEVAEQATKLREVPVLVSLGAVHPASTMTIAELAAEATTHRLPFAARPDDIACLLFTSGTTGPSKCCILGQRELWHVAHTMNAEMRTGSADRVLINMPMFHIGALAIIAGIHARGGTVLLQNQFDVAEAVGLIDAERITVLHLAPVMLQRLLDELADACVLDHVRAVVYSAAPMPVTTLRRAIAMLPKAGFLNLYGQTEGIVSGLPRELHAVNEPEAHTILGSVGYPFPGVSVRIVDESGEDVEAGRAGEILVGSDFTFRGYWEDAAATAATLRDGWCHTGDIGRFDDRGLLYLVDRKKDIIITGGENVFSPEVEDAVCGLAPVAACAVVGVPDERWGETVCAVVVLRAGTSLLLTDVQEHLRATLAGYKLPRRLVVVDELPMLASGKVDKKRLRAMVSGDAR